MSKETIAYDVELTNGLVANLDNVSSSPHSIAPTAGVHPYYLAVDTSLVAITVNLPTTVGNGMELGRLYNIIDSKGNASNNNITLDAGSGNTINGSQTTIINSDYTSYTILCVGISPVEWNIV